MECAGCIQKIVDEPHIACSAKNCGKMCHLICGNALNFNSEQMKTWMCPDCQARSRVGGDNSDTPVRPPINNITYRRINGRNPSHDTTQNPPEDMKSLISEIRMLRADMAKLTSDFTSRFESLSKQITEYDARIQKLEERDKENALLKAQVVDLQNRLNQQAQQSLSSELEIMGLPETPNENPYHIVLTTASKLGMNLDEVEVNYVSRAGPRRSGDKSDQPRPLVVSFVRRAKREEFLKQAKTRRTAFSSKDIVPTGPTTKVFVNERLTSDGRRLFRDTRTWAKDHGYKYCWTRRGNIYIRKHEGKDGSPALQIRSYEDLQKLSGQ